jgi:hypothetical protein
MTKTSGNLRSAPSIHAALVLVFVSIGAGCSDDVKGPGLPSAALDASGTDVAVEDVAFDHAGRFHTPGGTSPATCLTCHAVDAPTSTAGWRSTTYTTSPFDYGTNSLGIPHGGGQDCSICHTGPGTGAWGDQPNWVGGQFAHVSVSLAKTTCIACHASQRPDLQPGATAATAAAQLGFDHAPYATVDCIGCHFATVAADTYVNYLNPGTLTLPGGDWKGGQSYPGSTPVGFPGEHIELQTTTLNRSSVNDLVIGATVAWEDVRDYMVHTSTAIPAEVRPGPPDAPDYGTCWHCHYSKNGQVTMYPMGKFHYSLAQYAVAPDGPITPLPQPAQGCKDCHAATQDTGIVATSILQPMQHGIEFAVPTTVAGVSAKGVKDLDCSTCHSDPLGVFSGGVFHTSIAAATLQDCVSCHYVTMADEPTSDVQNGTAYLMRHTSAQMPFQTCTACHLSALANATTPDIAADSWKPGQYHAVLSMQPTACNDCHTVSAPATHSTVTPIGGTPDCSDCHSFPGTGTATAPNWLGATNPL